MVKTQENNIGRECRKESIKKTLEILAIGSPAISGIACGFCHAAELPSKTIKNIYSANFGLYTLSGGVIGATESLREGKEMVSKFSIGMIAGGIAGVIVGGLGYVIGYGLGYMGKNG